MGQKVNPVGMRVGINKNWNSRWFASNKDYSNFLIEDNKIRKFIEKNLDNGENFRTITLTPYGERYNYIKELKIW